ncbi:PREDICTED: eukaryotic translation initiation factor 2-alpha kinase isoform X1 [Acromyrmex echinatior]|uniref:eukaryotic translation initiation factor 2-alpha kinase isoform X1 n=1 Tax=Acromyrmex echinatior TaxID=103372 RepID=UPI000580E445|nr:PREDICTED: eukaryotic translation initiation factor 2-alpha kinase isoform X1 [Acromyrmex echinatior]
MSHLWQQICFYCLVTITIVCSLVFAEDALLLKSCDQHFKDTRSLIFVSTLDGNISALNASNYGKKQWTIDFNNGPMLSSSIHDTELNNNGQWVRLIPSLSGQLYKFDGENLETMPITADQLLHLSLRFSDDLVYAGGKELHSYGVFANTGEIKYKCVSGVSECKNNTDSQEYVEEDILIIQRFQQTVRAIEDRAGSERWNFSVGQYELKLKSPVSCSNEDIALNIEIKAVIPEGLIWAVDKSNPKVTLWQYKFDSPIVAIWRGDVSSGPLEKIDLFDTSQWVWGSEYSAIRPGLYLGMHERQLYVQENYNNKNLLESKYVQYVKYPWQPYPAAITAVVNTLPNKDNDEDSIKINEAQNAIALSVLYSSEYINGNGFYLYSTDQVTNKQCNHSNSDILLITSMEKSMQNYVEEENIIPTKVVMSIWDWWKEILVISITTAFLLNFMLTQRFFNVTTVATKDAIPAPLIVERHIETKISDTTDNNGDNFYSRFLMDYELVDCLGKGGYGVVFEVKNKIDDCNYAIKRIALSNNEDSRDRVTREVRALAKLEHLNIVRYYYAWLECPPSGWQEEHDQQWIDKLKCSTDFLSSEITQTETKLNHSVYIDVSQTDQSSVESACEAFELNKVANDDSYIIFERSNEKQYDNNSICIDTYSTENSDLSISSNITEKELSYNNETDYSESIVFEETDDIAKEKKKRKPQKPFSLDLKKKPNTKKSAKMFLYIQMQLCQRLSLREWLKQHTSERDFNQILNIFQQIVDAVEYVHLQGLIHRDLKPSNIFFALDGKIKIGDFGLVTAMIDGCDRTHTPAAEYENVSLKNNVHTACVGTHLYMSPEQMNGQKTYNYKVDIYSLGIIFFELLIPFSTDMERIATLSNLKKSIFPKDFSKNYPAEYDLLKMMLDEDPMKRPTTLGIKARPPLQNYEVVDFNTDKDSKWHFELPQLTRHSSLTNSSNSNGESENIN